MTFHLPDSSFLAQHTGPLPFGHLGTPGNVRITSGFGQGYLTTDAFVDPCRFRQLNSSVPLSSAVIHAEWLWKVHNIHVAAQVDKLQPEKGCLWLAHATCLGQKCGVPYTCIMLHLMTDDVLCHRVVAFFRRPYLLETAGAFKTRPNTIHHA
jgi:hypothetical protein